MIKCAIRNIVSMAVLAVVLAACHGSGASNNDLQSALRLPPGVVVPADVNVAAERGLYPSQTQSDCCFLASTASFEAAKSPGKGTALISVWVPDIPYVRQHGQSIVAAFDGISVGGPRNLKLGGQTVSFSLPKELAQARQVHVRLTMKTSYIPKTLGINGDVRRLSLILVRVAFK